MGSVGGPMTRVCAWCGATLPPPVDPRWEPNAGSWGVDAGPDGLVSHGICGECVAKISPPDDWGPTRITINRGRWEAVKGTKCPEGK